MKPDWDKLMAAFADSETALVADVDCTAEGKDLCTEHGVRGYPTIKWGDPSNLEDYQGSRDFAALEKFAKENLKPMCSPSNIDLCEGDKKAQIEKFLGHAEDELDKMIAEKEKEVESADAAFKAGVEELQAKYQELMAEKEVESADAAFKAGVEELQAKYQELMAEKEKKEAEIKESGLGLMKACKVHAAKSKGSDEL